MPDASRPPLWEPPEMVSRDEIVRRSSKVLAAPEGNFLKTENIFCVRSVGLDWDMGAMVYEPEPAAATTRGADGRKVGILLVHGGSGDYKSMEPMAKVYAARFGYKALSVTMPGRHCFDEPSRDWPGDTLRPDGSVRTPIWKRGEHIGRDQYDVVSDTTMKLRYGTRTIARAKPGTVFHDRMAGWLPAFEEGMKDAMRRHFPPDEYSIYLTGHSTGGPHVFMMCQRVPNVAGMIAIENSPFGFIGERQHDWSGALGKVIGFERVATRPAPRTDPFDELYIRSWRDRARYAGPEALGQEGPNALMRLPSLMEEVLDWWDKNKARPQFKAEYILTHNVQASLTAAAEVTARRLDLSPEETQALVERYRGYPYPLRSRDAKAVPPVLFMITKNSRDHSPEVYEEVVLPMFAEINPAPKVRLVRLDAGVHAYAKPETDLPQGVLPAAAEIFNEAITEGYFVV